MKLLLPDKVKFILNRMEDAGFEAYAVGGCVRDSLLGREPHDWDITTSARPEQVKKLFRRTVDTGIQHGTVTVMLDHEGFEVTTYRVDGIYKDGRHPEDVTFTASLEEDLKRRDFTINAMACNEEGVIDRFGGLDDLKAGIIRAVGDPHRRFEEDALRIMRAVRFSAQLGYTIDEKTFQAAEDLAPNLEKISKERIMSELNKLMVSPHPDRIRAAWEAGITRVILPEFDVCMETPQHNPHHLYTVGEHIIRSVQNVRPDLVLRLTMLFHDIGKPACRTTDEKGIDHFYGHPEVSARMAGQIMRRLKYDNETREKVVRLTRFHDIQIGTTARSVRRAVHKIGEDIYPLLMEVKLADIAAQSSFHEAEKIARINEWQRLYREVRESGDALGIRDLAVNGKDLMDAGVREGPEIGQCLNRMLQDVLDDPSHNNHEYLMKTYVLCRTDDNKKV